VLKSKADTKKLKNQRRKEKKRSADSANLPSREGYKAQEQRICPLCFALLDPVLVLFHLKTCVSSYEQKLNASILPSNPVEIQPSTQVLANSPAPASVTAVINAHPVASVIATPSLASATDANNTPAARDAPPNENISRKCYINSCTGVFKNSKYACTIMVGSHYFEFCGPKHFHSVADINRLRREMDNAYSETKSAHPHGVAQMDTVCGNSVSKCTKKGSSAIGIRSYKGVTYQHYCSTDCLLDHASKMLDKTWSALVKNFFCLKEKH